ncbi:MAG TPA: hypothetical protein VFJ77_01040 [Gaiellaceae bacterium]|nr:hypothetical protein [Gaiellaceae bacterium]
MLLGRQTSFLPSAPVGAYWLSRCEGFAVEGRDGRTGVVAEVVFTGPMAPASYLVVQMDGLFEKRRVIAADEVADVDPWNRRLRLRASFRAAARRTRRSALVRGLQH